MKRLVLVSVILMCLSSLLFAAEPVDNRVISLLNSLGFNYDIDSENDFRLLMDLGDGRSQEIFINSATNTSRGQEIREVWSIAIVYDDSIPQEAAQRVLLDSYDKIIGSWYAIQNGESYYLAFCAKIPADASSTYMNSAILAVARGADSMESELADGVDTY